MISHRIGLRAAFSASAAVLVLACAATPAAARQAAAPHAPAGATHQIRIEAQSLDRAVIALSEQTNTVILATEVSLEGRRSSTLVGSMTVAQALARLLEGSNLTYRRDPNGWPGATPISMSPTTGRGCSPSIWRG